MEKLEPFPVAVALIFVFIIFFTVCVALHLLTGFLGIDTWPMHHLWQALLPGVEWISPASYVTGLVELSLGGFYIAYVLIPLYNYFSRRLASER